MKTPVVLGLDFGGSKIAVALADLSGRRIADTTVETDPSRGARWNLDQGLSAACDLLDGVVPGHEVAAVGACTFGIPVAHGVGLAPAILGWGELALGEELATRFAGSAIRLVTDVKAAAAAEAGSGALVGHDPAIYLNLGTGLAVAIVCGGQVVSGANGAAGEIGYNLRQLSDLGLTERVVLEEVVSGMGLSASGERTTGRAVSAAEVFAGEAGDESLGEVMDQFVRELSFHLVNLAVALDPSRIAVGGGMVRSWDRLEPSLRRALETAVPFPPELVVGAYPFDAPLVGALNLALAAAAERPGGADDLGPAPSPRSASVQGDGSGLSHEAWRNGTSQSRAPVSAEQPGFRGETRVNRSGDGVFDRHTNDTRPCLPSARAATIALGWGL